MRLILLGPPGTGKGTQSKLLERHFRVPQISTGDMFRAAICERTEVGLEVERFLDSGKLVPDNLVTRIVRERLAKPDTNNGFLFDGFPRTVEQAESLEGLLLEMKVALDAVVFIHVADEEVVKRLSNRRICKDCGKVYNLAFQSEEIESSRCATTGKRCRLIQRSDDEKEVVQERLKVYNEQTAPLVDYYKQQGILIAINGHGSVNQVFDRIIQAL